MKELKRNLKDLNIVDRRWTLFLDRDGVINRKIEGGYVTKWEEFEFLPKVIEALRKMSNIFGRIIIVTNQRGIGRGLMTEENLKDIHDKMLMVFRKNGIRIAKIYYCPHDYEKEECNCRKPKIAMALNAQKDFPDIDFKKSIMVGDSLSDIEFGKRLNMITVSIGKRISLADFYFKTLYEFSVLL